MQLARKGFRTIVADHKKMSVIPRENYDVICVNTESRHLTAEQAYGRVRRVAQQFKNDVRLFYKKTDSALRGNVASEMEALMDSLDERTGFFVPAFPQNRRTTKEGRQYIEGVPVEQSVFGEDPFEPVRESYIPNLFAKRQNMRVEVLSPKDEIRFEPGCKTVFVFDAESGPDLQRALERIASIPEARVIAGCAGFAEVIPQLLSPVENEREFSRQQLPAGSQILLVSGSQNDITMRQVEEAAKAGIPLHRLSTAEELRADYCCTPGSDALISLVHREMEEYGMSILAVARADDDPNDSMQEMACRRKQVCTAIRRLTHKILASKESYHLVIFGGDTVAGIVNEIYGGIVYPIEEILSGVVLADVMDAYGRRHCLVSKSGGFGSANTILTIASALGTDILSKMEIENE